jgi:hypothetical protein
MSGDIFGCHNWNTYVHLTCIEPVEARDAAKYTVKHTASPHNKELSRLDISSAKVEALRLGGLREVILAIGTFLFNTSPPASAS